MAAKWKVTSQTHTTQLSDTGTGFVNVWEVRYEITDGKAKGTKGVVEIPVTEYSAATVKNAIDTAVHHLDAVASL